VPSCRCPAYSCENVLGAYAVPSRVSCCKYDGAEPQLDVPGAGVPAVRADRGAGLRRRVDADGRCEDAAPERCRGRRYRPERGSTFAGRLEEGGVEGYF